MIDGPAPGQRYFKPLRERYMGVLSAREKLCILCDNISGGEVLHVSSYLKHLIWSSFGYLALRSVEMASVSLQGARKLWNTEACRLPGHSNEVSRIVWLDEF